MSTHNICFRGEIRKISAFFWKKKALYLLLCEAQLKMSYLHVSLDLNPVCPDKNPLL